MLSHLLGKFCSLGSENVLCLEMKIEGERNFQHFPPPRDLRFAMANATPIKTHEFHFSSTRY